MSFPQLRIRTGYTYRDAYGRMPEVIEKIKEVGAPRAAIVDANTWGHVRFEQAATKEGVVPMFGMEIPLLVRDDSPMAGFKPRMWVLARDTRKFYNLTSKCVRNKGLTEADMAEAGGVFRFLGGAVLADVDEDAYDYIDVNPSSLLLAAQAVSLARSTGKPMVITGYNDMPDVKHRDFAHAWEVRESVGVRCICSVDEMWDVLQHVMTRPEFDFACINTHKVADALDGVKLQKAPLIHLEGDLESLVREGQESRLARGHIKDWTDEYEDRLKTELEQIRLKEFDSYFLVVSDLVKYAKRHMLVGPARGSSAGSLVCYLLEITEVDPLPYGLLFQRFIDISRADLPDIDIDFADTKRHLVFEYLQEKYGIANVAKLGNINTLKAASVMAQVGKRFGIPFGETAQVKNALIEYSSGDARYGKGLQDTLDTTTPGQDFAKRHPEAAACMGDLEIHPSHTGVHAAGILVCNDPISDYCTVNDEGIAQIDKPDSEYLNLLKIDALGLRTLGIIEDSGVVTAEELYSLTFDDQSVLDILNDDKVSGIFQFEGDAVRSVTRSVFVDEFSKIDNLTALARPGPLASGMAQKYIARASGKEPVKYDVPQLEKYLSDTYGVFLYQEQIMSVVKEIGLFDWVKTSAVRKAMSGRKGEEYFNKMGEDFVNGATSQGINQDQAKKMWNEMVTFGSWGFNKSHSLSYAVVTYWTLWLKRYYPLQFAAACLRAAKDDEQVIAILRELQKEGIQYTPIDPDHSEMNWTVADGRLIGGIMNAKGYGPAKASLYVQKRAAGLLTDKDREKLASAKVMYSDLQEAHTLWGAYYANPRLAGVTSGNPIIGMKECKDKDDCLVIGKLTKKILADENEAIRIKKRGGTIKKGKTAFIDLMMVDDSSDSPMRFRIRPDKYEEMGKPIAEGAPKDTWFLIKAWKIEGIDMFIVKNIKQLDLATSGVSNAK
ncbi:DNA polymerase III subunit alpha [Luteibacter phage vB_LflM-Pluto]|uniref:DNA polymerase III subunit alpha n=1 Tax=Luteibacter phage vB_LflM-Pluto TaxID=2948611 RepID=A0A9E7MUQ2_9CAUD|nr:DNA polymerase III subunit alpha [Luteibacter phage vB_LflM-Pluto]